MELQLALALPSLDPNTARPHVQPFDFDLNSCCGSASDSDSGSVSASSTVTGGSNYGYYRRKRRFDDALNFDDQVRALPLRTLPLFISWNKQPRRDDDDDDDQDHPREHRRNNSSFSSSNKAGDEDGVVGWPPIKNCRKKLCNQQHHGGDRVMKNNRTMWGNGSTYVKVKMEGVAIARKIDLSLYNSFETLTSTLIAMFGFWHEGSSYNYHLTFQDRDGSWLKARAFPWRTFIRTVQRLKLSKSSH